MGVEYDLKFEEMKKYIPFLDGMIERLETNGKVTGNPRQAQLTKIKSLRELLSIKKKRMKMENLHKCELVLVNLYAKVESQRLGNDPGFSIDPPTPQEKSDLEAVRNKLKTVTKRQEDEETLPEILRVDEVEEMHTAGSKEPALFQRRPNKMSVSPTHHSPAKIKEDKVSPQSSASKRNYTRVLVSPDSSRRRWSTPDSAEEKPLFSRRSPRRSPRRSSPSYHKKERKKSLKESTRKSKGVNITLNVPENSLTSLNTKDIFTRIIDCKDGDVDIDTLRELRKQILGELKKTGKKDDISDLILKSYNKKKDRLKRKGQEEVEEGELSDSESEVIESLYGNLSGNLVLKDQGEANTSNVKDKNRKIQICLVINSDDSNPDRDTNTEKIINSDVSELEMYNKESEALNKAGSSKEKIEQDFIKIDDEDESITTIPDWKKNIKEDSSTDKESSKNNAFDEMQQPSDEEKKVNTPKEPVKYRANFYKSLTDSSEPVEENIIIQDSKEAVHAQVETQEGTDIKTDRNTETTVWEVPKTSKDVCLIEAELEKMENPVEIPLLNEPTIPGTPTNSMLSEIDILQALKNEILSESIIIPGSEAGTPLLHQPKVNKVASAKEILPKKRISIENYKQKTDREKIMSSIKFYLEDNDSKDDLIKKPSLKLTEKECERFNIQKKMSFDDDSSVSDDGGDIQASDLYSDLAPKSLDRDESSNMEMSPPPIIPDDSAKAVPVNRNVDVDMRTLPILSPNQKNASTLFSTIVGLSLSNTNTISATKTDKIKSQNKPVLFDPRVRRDVNSSQSPSPHNAHPDRTPRSSFSSINQSPASNAVTTPNARSYDMTNNHQSFDVDQSNKHVYMPSFTMFDSKDRENSVAKDSKKKPPRERKSRFEDIGDTSSWSSSDVSINTRTIDSFTGDKYSKGRNDRYSFENRDCFSYNRSECPRTPLPSFGRSDVPVTSTQIFSRLDKPMTLHSFGRAECPTTPSHHFGRSECPPTPIHSFGRSDCPSTPSNPFGSLPFNINECPLTPSHQFGVTECPPTPYYGRNDCPPTPNHGFGRSDCSSTPNHPFGRSDFNAQNYIKDPRLNRKPEYESNSQLNDRDRGYYKDSGYHRGSSCKSQKPFSGSDTYRSQDTEQGRNSKYRYYAPEQTGRQFRKDPPRREQTVGGLMANDNENDRLFSRERGKYNSGYEEVALRRGNHPERSIGRSMHPEDKHERGVGQHNRADDTFTLSSSRGPSVRSSIEAENKLISVKSGTGSFKIDTSVNETFQNFLESVKGIQVFEYNFDARRQRAASVGRPLVRESCCEQVSDGSKPNSEPLNKKEVFRRASSMGKDLTHPSAEEKSFQEIKADFKTYRHPVKEPSKFDIGKIRNIDTKSKTNAESIGRSRREKESYKKYKEEKRAQSTSKLTYSPGMNDRDPRMRKEMKMKNKYEDSRARKSGIIYSNDNIVKGAILASGYGVKNYKIPKIKRVVEEKEVEKAKKEEHINKKDEKDKRKYIEKRKEERTIKEKANDKSKDKKVTPKPKTKDTPNERSDESPQHKIKEISKGKIKEIIKESDTKSDSETEKLQIHIDDTSETDEHIGRRSSRLSRKLAVKNAKSRKPKKSIISDSDSETDNNVTEKLPKVDETELSTTTPAPPPQVTRETTPPQVTKEKIVPKQPNAIDMHSNFGLELEMFTDNVVSDPVLDNINALIADLDNDLDASKNESSNNFTNEITLENMMQNITSPQDNSSESRDDFTNVLKDVELSKTTDNKMHENSLSDLNKVTSDIAALNTEVSQILKNTEDSNSKSTATQSFDNQLASVQNEEMKNKESEASNSNLHLSKPTNEDIVSTTETEKDKIPIDNKSQIDERSMDGCSTPDSTIDTDVLDKNKSNDCIADSTNEEVHSETNVTSTDSVEPEPEAESDLELGSLLTMLQDKSKIKKLLIMLGDQSGDNDKIKKKLEKLSEIVSDNELEETTQQPEKSKTEVAVIADDKKPDANPTVAEEATIETESRSHGDEKTKINKNDGETPLNKNIKETQLNKGDEEMQSIKNDEETQLNKGVEETQLNKNDEETQSNKNGDGAPLNKNDETRLSKNNMESQLNKNDEETQLNKNDEATQLNKNDEETQLNRNDEETQLNKNNEETQLNKNDEETQLNKNDEETQLNKNDEATQLTKNDDETQLNKNDKGTPLNKNDEETQLKKNDDETKLNKSSEETQLNNDEDLDNDGDHDNGGSFEDVIDEDAAEAEETDLQVTMTKYKRKMTGKKSKTSKKGKGRRPKKVTSVAEKRVTRATAAVETKKKPKKPPRELQKLHEDIREMFIRDDILSATGIRMCRLAKMVDEKTKEDVVLPEPEPVVVLEKFKSSTDKSRDNPIPEKVRKKPGPKPKPKISTDSSEIAKPKYKPGPKSKTKNKKEMDPYAFETGSVGDTTVEKASEDESDSSDSEVGSLASSKSYGSTEILSEIKKKKRKRGRWQDGVIKPKTKKKKLEMKEESTLEPPDCIMPTERQIIAPDPNAPFTDKNYCFRKNELHYPCRLCEFTGSDIVHHYVSEHPHVEIPLSRMAPALAKEAIDQCKEINFNDFSKISSEKYVCIFCYKEFAYNSSVLETFFWHIVSMHTGEYKHSCSECSNENQCTFRLDIPPPPNETNGQLIGYICKKCNFTQLSLENLKNHVVRRHNDEHTAVYTINLSAMSKKTLKDFLRFTLSKPPAIPRVITARLNKKPSNVGESSKQPPSIKVLLASIKSKITFEADDNVGELFDLTDEDSKIKIERVDSENKDGIVKEEPHPRVTIEIRHPAKVEHQPVQPSYQKDQKPSVDAGLEDLASQPSNDIVDYPHFKINTTESGAKEYICCINGKDNHFKTTLLISMKKHVQLKHSESWDGYCFICKVIVTPQGAHKFKDCFQHYLDKHLDNFPIYQKEVVPESAPEKVLDKQVEQTESPASSKPYLNVRPINELISTAADDTPKETSSFPIIQSVVSLGAESPRLNPTYPTERQEKKQTEVSFKYEEVQAKVMLNKHRVVLETMMARNKLIKVFKCAGRFCSFTSDSAEDALLHASTHQRIGGADALNCSYCDFDALGNAIDLVMHVFKAHGNCQYSCGRCFYRAAASQSVGAHATRVHGVAQSGATVLRTTVATNASDGGLMLTREQAVPYYICHHAESGSKCKFRTYTQDKFCEHLQQKHVGATTHPCYNCQLEVSSPSELVQHMKSHGLKLYQCTWCVLGADNEGELLAHVSTVHPTKQPQAYLRIITNKEGSNELRVLPLAFLNKMKVPTIDVTPSAIKENPVREAERSIDLEKLIGLTMMMEPQLDLSEPTLEEHPQDMIPEVVKQPVAPNVPVASTAPIMPVAPTVSVADLDAGILSPVSKAVASITGPSLTDVTNQPSVHTPDAAEPPLTITRVPIKTEIETPESVPREVVVLDSDDEDPQQPVIDLSDEDTASNKQALTQAVNQKVPTELLSTCPRCQQICKSINGLKKHFFYCYPDKEQGCKCAHCPYMASNRDNIMHHYMNDHCDRNVYQCGVCRSNLVNLAMVKRHLKYVHKEKDFVVTTTTENGISLYVVNAAKKEKKELPKRKLSVSATESLNKRRFWPREINQLPINPILDQLVYCEICEFSTKVRLNMVRHLQLHAEQQPVAQTAPVNPVPHLETNEKHFDRMVNLASSSLQPRDRPAPPAAPPALAALPVPRELAPRYPQQISARARNTCGAVGCTYTSVDEPMLKRHWEALHSGPASFNFRCVHCPDNQTTDTSKPITANRVVQHLKMHDDTLYACSKCHLYHYKRDFIEKHIMEVHQNAPLYIVRESGSAAAAAAATAATTASVAATPSAAPTMDLKPWQCGFCKFKSMLRPEVTDHCFKLHQSKMQFRCGYCPYRASALENVNNHLAHSHANEPEDVIYYYYREGSLPDEADGTPRWMKQRQKMGSNLPEVKTEEQETPNQTPPVPPPPVNIDLKLVKKEVDEGVPESAESMGDLCERFGQFCESNGIRFKCPLCNVITEETREAMQSHLYEELQYRKWGCGLCNYKAFHKAGLTEHMSIEHFRQYEHIELPIDVNKEKWVAGQLDHQASIIDKHKANLAKQKITVEKVTKPVSVAAPPTVDVVEKFSIPQMEEALGEFGEPSNSMYCCPKCDFLTGDEAVMRDHLEMELNKIRWGCTNCSVKYQTFHEAQFHSKGHDGPSWPLEAVRDPSMRAAWVTNCIQLQKKKILQCAPVKPSESTAPDKSFTETDNNSLLVVRYEERVPTPDLVPASRKRAAPDSDEERLVIDEAGPKKRVLRPCPHCPYKSKFYNTWREHVLKHHNLKPYACCYCDYSFSYRQGLIGHTEKAHPGQTLLIKMTGIPPAESYILSPKKRLSAEEETNVTKIICLFCENSIPETDIDNHLHENIRPDFARKGDVVVKCCICLVLRLDVKSLQEHHSLAHPHIPVNYALFKLRHNTRETHFCGHCDDIGFKFLRDLKTHHNAVHPTLLFKYTTVPYVPADGNRESRKKEEPRLLKRCARKSTTKLPGGKTVAKKSTTKLPYRVPSTSDDGYSYYKTKPESLENYANVTTLMSFCNRMMPFTLKKLSEIINIEPIVIVKDIRAGTSSDNMTL